MHKLSAKGMLLIALVLSIVTALLVYNYLSGITAHKNSEMVSAVVAVTDIPAKTRILPQMVKIISVPAEYVQPGTAAELKDVVGVIAREQIAAGEQITNRRLLIEGNKEFTAIIPLGKRAVTVPVTEVTGVAGFIKPGDFVDVTVTFDQSTAGDYLGDVVLQNLQVLAVNHNTENGSNNIDKEKKENIKTATVTLAVEPELLHYLAVSDDRGKIRLALRPYMENEAKTITKAVSARELMGKQNVKNVQETESTTTDGSPVSKFESKPSDGTVIMIRGTKTETLRY